MGAKIAFIGTHGVGKTVLTYLVASRLRALSLDADVAEEKSRRSPFPINEATTLEGQLWILAAQWREELEASRRAAYVVCDRSVLDNYAYLERACGEQPWLRGFLAHWSRTYDALFWVPIVEDRIVADGTRSTAPAFQRDIDRRVGDLVERFGIGDRVVRLPPERARQPDFVLEEMTRRGLLPKRQRFLFPELERGWD